MEKLKRALTLPGLTMIAVGACIGSGIFMTPSVVASDVPDAKLILLVWLIGGLITVTGSLTFAELGSMFPKAGGVYVYIRDAYGPLMAFLYGWVFLTVINTGALAALGIACVDFLGFFVEIGAFAQIGLAAALIITLSLINILGVNVSQWLISGFTGLKIAALVAIVFAALCIASPTDAALSVDAVVSPKKIGFSSVFVALVGVLWSYGGWYHATFLAGETKNPNRTVPRALIIGALIVTLVYVSANWAYLKFLSIEELAASNRVAADALQKVLPYGAKLVAAAVILSIIGTISIYTMSAPRIYFAMAEDGVFFKALAKVHPKYRTPHVAILLQVGMALILLLAWKTFHNLITYVTFIDMVFLILGALSLFIFRKTKAEVERPFKVWLYPILPAFFIAVGSIFLVSTLIERPVQTIGGLVVLSSGILVYFAYKAIGNTDKG